MLLLILLGKNPQANDDEHNSVQFLQKPYTVAGSQFLISFTLGQSHSNNSAKAREQLLPYKSWAAGAASLGSLRHDADSLSQQMGKI